MSKLSSGASYMSKDSVPAKRFTKVKKSPAMVIASMFVALLTLFLAVQPLMMSSVKNEPSSSNSYLAQAGGFLCSTKFGSGMDGRGSWEPAIRELPQSNATGRVWTLQEAFGKSMTFTNYEGEGAGDNKIAVKDKPAPDVGGKYGNYEAVSAQLNEARNWEHCSIQRTGAAVGTFVLGMANMFASVTQMFVVFAFDSNIICEDAANPQGACLNILKVLGGSSGNSGEGLIGTLTSTIYLPLLVLVAAVTGGWVAYKGMVQRKIREALFGALWVVGSVLAGLVVLLNPMLLAKAPMAVSNTISACVIGAFNGDNCMTDSNSGSGLQSDEYGSTSDKVCKSTASGVGMSEQMSMTVNSLACSVWKAFVLEPYAQGSFGTSFESLDTKDSSQPTRALIEKAGIDPDTFCVGLKSNESVNFYKGKELQLQDNGTDRVCNLLAYQMYLQTNAKSGSDVSPAVNAADFRWYNVVVTAAHDEGIWTQWAPSATGSAHKLAVSSLAVVTTVVGSIVLIVISFYALVYYLSSIILMGFAPLFLLLGVHPGRGKKILFGWLEKVVSNVLKYLVSAIFLIVAIAFYGAILGGISNIGLSLLFVLIISGALFLYRREVTDMVGRVSMGGESMSSAFTDKLKDKALGVKDMGVAAVGGGVGSKLAGGKVLAGASDGFRRELSRGGAKKVFGNTAGDFVTQTVRQQNRGYVDNAQDFKKGVDDTKAEATVAETQAKTYEDQYNTEVHNLEQYDNSLSEFDTQLINLDALELKYEGVQDTTVDEFKDINQYFALAQGFLNQMDRLRHDRALAVASGDTKRVDEIDRETKTLDLKRQVALENIPQGDLKKLRGQYNARLEENMYRSGVDYSNKDAEFRTTLAVDFINADGTRSEMVDRVNDLAEKANEAKIAAAGSSAKAEFLDDEDTKRQPGDKWTVKKTQGLKDAADKIAETAEGNVPLVATVLDRPVAHVIRDSKKGQAHDPEDLGRGSTAPRNNNRENREYKPDNSGSGDQAGDTEPIQSVPPVTPDRRGNPNNPDDLGNNNREFNVPPTGNPTDPRNQTQNPVDNPRVNIPVPPVNGPTVQGDQPIVHSPTYPERTPTVQNTQQSQQEAPSNLPPEPIRRPQGATLPVEPIVTPTPPMPQTPPRQPQQPQETSYQPQTREEPRQQPASSVPEPVRPEPQVQPQPQVRPESQPQPAPQPRQEQPQPQPQPMNESRQQPVTPAPAPPAAPPAAPPVQAPMRPEPQVQPQPEPQPQARPEPKSQPAPPAPTAPPTQAHQPRQEQPQTKPEPNPEPTRRNRERQPLPPEPTAPPRNKAEDSANRPEPRMPKAPQEKPTVGTDNQTRRGRRNIPVQPTEKPGRNNGGNPGRNPNNGQGGIPRNPNGSDS